jgi:hypothetical protein
MLEALKAMGCNWALKTSFLHLHLHLLCQVWVLSVIRMERCFTKTWLGGKHDTTQGEIQTCWLTIPTPSQEASDVNYKHKILLKNYNFVAFISFVLYMLKGKVRNIQKHSWFYFLMRNARISGTDLNSAHFSLSKWRILISTFIICAMLPVSFEAACRLLTYLISAP